MKDSVIAIRTADGKLFPILQGASGPRRRLVLTTVRDDQPSVHIDLFQMEASQEDLSDYIGSLVIEDLTEAPAGGPEINLIVGIDDRGNLNATATDVSSGDYQSLSVSLQDADGAMEALPDFELSDDELVLPEDTDESLVEDVDTSSFDLDSFDEPGLIDVDEQDSAHQHEDEQDRTEADDFSLDDELSLDDMPDEFDQPDESGESEESGEVEDLGGIGKTDDSVEAGPEPDGEEFDRTAAYSYRATSAETATRSSREAEEIDAGELKNPPALLFVAYILLAAAILIGLIFIIYRSLEGPPLPRLEASMAGLFFLRGKLKFLRLRKRCARTSPTSA